MTEDPKSTKKTVGIIPRKEADIIAIATNVLLAWQRNPAIILVWITIEQLREAVSIFADSFATANDMRSTRVSLTMKIKAINNEINKSSMYVKHYISDMFSVDEAPAYYPQFGMVKTKNGYVIPRDLDRRQHALEQMIVSIERHGMNDNRYGKDYWEDIYSRFTKKRKCAQECDDATTEHVNIKNTQRAIIIRALNSLVMVIKSNFPETYKEELRAWGFRKEKYH